MEGRVAKFFRENKSKFETKRQASKYLNGYGIVYKKEEGIELSASKRKEK